MPPSFQTTPWAPIRNLIVDLLHIGQRVHMVHSISEADISHALKKIAHYKPLVPHGVSLTAYLVYCFAHALDEHKMLHAYRKGNQLVHFDDIDVNTILEKQNPNGTVVPVMYIVRGANHKSLAAINYEIYQAGQGDLSDDATVSRRRQLLKLPTPLRRLAWWWLLREPARMKQYWGTVGLSNFGAFISSRPVWGMPISFQTCVIVIGGMYDKLYWNDGNVEPRQTLCVTISVNHDIVDGAPAACFGETLAQLAENAEALDDEFLQESIQLSGE